MTLRIIVEGWRESLQSYALIHAYQTVELSRRSGIEVFQRVVKSPLKTWTPLRGQLPESLEATLDALPAPQGSADVTIRMISPLNAEPDPSSKHTLVFSTTEYHNLAPDAFVGTESMARLSDRVSILTPSKWSKEGLINAGVAPDKVLVVPHGVDSSVFRPPTSAERQRVREQLGLDGFVFFQLGAMFPNKGVSTLLKAFASVARTMPEARLLLKGLTTLYHSLDHLQSCLGQLLPEQRDLVLSRITYLGDPLSDAQTAALFWAADAYASPYRAEGFNLPVLEAISSGLPVICTRGGPTDDFVPDAAVIRVPSRVLPVQLTGAMGEELDVGVQQFADGMMTMMNNRELREKAAVAGPAHVAAHYTWPRIVDSLLPELHALAAT